MVARYGAAVAVTVFALLISLLLRPIVSLNPFLFFFASVAISAWYGGFGPGVLATALAVIAVDTFFLAQPYDLQSGLVDMVRLLIFSLVALLISSLNEARRRAEYTTRAQQQHSAVTLASISDAVIAVDTMGRVTLLNRAAAALTGWAPAAAHGQPIHAVFCIADADTRRPVADLAERVMRAPAGDLERTAILRPRDGAERPIAWSGAPIRRDDGALIGYVLVFRDVSARAQLDATRAESLRREQAAREAAERAIGQLSFLAEAGTVLGRSLDYDATLREVAALAVPRIGDWCAVDLLAGDGRLSRVAVVHRDPAKVDIANELYRRYPPEHVAQGGAWEVLRTGRPLLYTSLDDGLLAAGARDPEHLALLRALGMRAAIIAPLVGGAQILGVLILVMAESGRGYGPDDLDLATLLGQRAGQAIEKARLYADEQRSRVAAEQLSDRLSRLQLLTASLATALAPEDVARVVTEQCVLALGARASAVMAYDPERRTLRLLRQTGYGQAFEGWEEVSVDGPYPLSDAVRDGASRFFTSRAAFNASYPQLAPAPTITEAVAYLPLRVDGRVVGGMSIGFPHPRDLAVDERAFLEALAAQCAQALDRARLFTAEQHARDRLAFLAEVSTRLAASLDYDVTLRQITRLCVPQLADWCVIETPRPGGELVLEIVAHVDPAKEQWARELRARYPGRMDMPVGSPLVIRTGTSLLYPEVTDAMIQQAASDEEELRLLRMVGYRSMMVVPLRTHERIIGALGLIGTSESGRRYTADDLALAEELARRAAIAIDKAMLHRAAQEARAATEQAALRVARLQQVTAALGTTITPEQVGDVMVRVGLEAVGAEAGAVFLISDTGDTWVAVSFRGYPPELVPRHARPPAAAPGPLRDARDTRAPVLVETPEELVRRWPNLGEAQARSGDAAIAVIPLLLDQEVLGVLHIAFRAPRRFSADDVALLEALARQCAQALDRARLYRAEQAARTAAEEALTLRDQFLSIASHELKTPLTSLLLQTQLLQRRLARTGLLPEREQQGLQVVAEQAQRLNLMISALLDISRIELGQLSLSLGPVDLGDLACRVVAEVQPTTDQHQISCRAPAGPLIVLGDELRLEQVLQNLLQNAIKYSPGGGEISVTLAAEAGQATLAVADRGIGIPDEARSRIFERFYRAPNADPREISGLGIGLYVVREIVRLHGGEVQVLARPDGGSCFTVRLPQALDQLA